MRARGGWCIQIDMAKADDESPRRGSGGEEERVELPPPSRAPALITPRPSDAPLSDEQRLERFDEMRAAPVFFFALVALSIVGLAWILGIFIPDLVISFVLVALFRPLWARLTRRLGGRRWLASALVTTLIVIVVAAPVALLATTVTAEALVMYESIRVGSGDIVHRAVGPDGWLPRLRATVEPLGITISEGSVRELVTSSSQRALGAVIDQMTAILGRTLTVLFHALVVIVCVFYLLVDGDRLKLFLYRLSPLPDDEDELLVTKFQEVSRGILVGNGLGSVAQGVLGGLAMWAVGIPSAILWATVMSLFAFLPIVGISFVVIPATLYLFIKGEVLAGVGFFMFCTAQGLFMENVAKAWLIGRRTRMHDLLVFLSVLGGIAAFGIMGLLYGPLLVAAFLTLTELYNRVYHAKLAVVFAQRRR